MIDNGAGRFGPHYDDIQDDNRKNFGITQENLEKSQRQVPIYAVKPPLDGEQKIYVQGDMIPAKYLTVEQLKKVEEALAFDEAVAEFQTETAQKAYLCL